MKTMRRLLPVLISLGLSSCLTPLENRRQSHKETEDSNPASNDAKHGGAEGALEVGNEIPSSEVDFNFDPSILQPPYKINHDNIIRLVYGKSPLVTAAREKMLAARHRLDEFHYNLSRIEPFLESSGDLVDFPNRLGAFGTNTEGVFGVEKETFEGALTRIEVGGGYSDIHFSDTLPGEDRRERAGGLLLRGRIEQPFFGSRKLQNRIIAQAFQESTARKSQLDYLDDYNEAVEDAISYFWWYIYQDQYVGIYQKYIDDLQDLLVSPDLEEDDRGRVEYIKKAAERGRDEEALERQERLIHLLATLGIDPREEYVIEPAPPYKLSEFALDGSDTEQLESLVKRARENNPTFRVLNDTIKNAQLQRQQAIDGQFGITGSLEGTLFPLGSESFDDRLEGWTSGAGVAMRLNDPRVLRTTQVKAEAEIRQFRARIRAEEISMRTHIMNETRRLFDVDQNRDNIISALEQDRSVYKERRKRYSVGEVDIDQLLEARESITKVEKSLAANLYAARAGVRRLSGWLGSYYVVLGLEFGEDMEERDEND